MTSRSGVKKSANSNMYEVSLTEAWDRYGARLDGAFECPALVVSSTILPDQAKNALSSSIEALGYGKAACTFFVIGAIAEPAAADSLTDADLFSVIEGLDPLVLVIADEEAASACSRAYRNDVVVPDKGRLLGRDVVGFKNFAAMLETPQDKQRAWGLLKRLPRLES